MADTTEIAWVLEGPRRGGIRRYVGNPHGEPRYVDGSPGAHKFANKADAEAARRSGVGRASVSRSEDDREGEVNGGLSLSCLRSTSRSP